MIITHIVLPAEFEPWPTEPSTKDEGLAALEIQNEAMVAQEISSKDRCVDVSDREVPCKGLP